MRSLKRLHSEISQFKKAEGTDDSVGKITLEVPEEDDLYNLVATITGPPGTPYEGGVFVLDMRVPDDYPLHPPDCKFRTKIWHPNIASMDGYICMDTLTSKWTPAISLRSLLIMIQQLLANPEPDDPLEPFAARQMTQKGKVFHKIARIWTKEYAIPDYYSPGGRRTDLESTEEDLIIRLQKARPHLNRDEAITTASRAGWRMPSHRRTRFPRPSRG